MTNSNCKQTKKIIYSCSGAADVGELADKTMRVIKKEGFAQGSCIAAIGIELSGYVQSAKDADINIAIDGCSVGCARENLKKIGIAPFSINLADLGYKKGESPCTEALLNKAVSDIKNVFNKENIF